MQANVHAHPSNALPRPQVWTGRVITALVVAFLLFDSLIKVLQLAPAMEATTGLGYPAQAVIWLGVIQLSCLALYLVPRTSLLGAVLLTGYLGGAIATHVRAGSETFSLVFPVIIGTMLWGGLYLRDARLRQLALAGSHS
jgi:hypothetical protein